MELIKTLEKVRILQLSPWFKLVWKRGIEVAKYTGKTHISHTQNRKKFT